MAAEVEIGGGLATGAWLLALALVDDRAPSEGAKLEEPEGKTPKAVLVGLLRRVVDSLDAFAGACVGTLAARDDPLVNTVEETLAASELCTLD